MEKLKKVKLPLFFLLSFIVLNPIISAYLKSLENCFNMKSNNGLAVIIWALVSFIVILTTKNIAVTRENAKIEVEGINLKKKDRNLWNSRLGNKGGDTRIFKYWKKRWNYFR